MFVHRLYWSIRDCVPWSLPSVLHCVAHCVAHICADHISNTRTNRISHFGSERIANTSAHVESYECTNARTKHISNTVALGVTHKSTNKCADYARANVVPDCHSDGGTYTAVLWCARSSILYRSELHGSVCDCMPWSLPGILHIKSHCFTNQRSNNAVTNQRSDTFS